MECPAAVSRLLRVIAPARPSPFPPYAGKAATRACAPATTALLVLAGCANGGGLGSTVDRTLATVGLKDARVIADRQHAVALELHGAGNLNAGNEGRGVALVIRVYQLRNPQRFEQLPMARLLVPHEARDALGEDLVDVDERLLLPGETLQWPLRLADDTRHVGVAALFRHPGDGPWRLVFDGRGARQHGIVIGAHACALTTASPALATMTSTNPLSLSGVRCGNDR